MSKARKFLLIASKKPAKFSGGESSKNRKTSKGLFSGTCLYQRPCLSYLRTLRKPSCKRLLSLSQIETVLTSAFAERDVAIVSFSKSNQNTQAEITNDGGKIFFCDAKESREGWHPGHGESLCTSSSSFAQSVTQDGGTEARSSSNCATF